MQPLPDNAVLDEDPRQAVSYALLGVMANHSDCIDLYSNMILEGYATLAVDENTSGHLNDTACRSAETVVDGVHCCRASFSRARHMLDEATNAAELATNAAEQRRGRARPSRSGRLFRRRSPERARTAEEEIFEHLSIAIDVMVGDSYILLQTRAAETIRLGPPPLDPVPLILAATDIDMRRDLWTDCKFAGQSAKRQGRGPTQEERDAFRVDLDERVQRLRRRALSCCQDPQYHEVRVDWLAWDRKWLIDLERRLGTG